MTKYTSLIALALVVAVSLVVYTRYSKNSNSRSTAATQTQMDSVPEVVGELKVEDITPGKGKPAKAGKMVTVHYTGWLADGKKFDSSKDHGQPFKFPLGAGQVISGWDKGIEGMKVGGKRKLTIPPNMAYGKRGAGSVIPPNAFLSFEVELLDVQ